MIGATTENPSFEVNAALLSRCKVFVLKALEVSDLVELLKHALQDERGFGSQHVLITEEQLHMLAVFANGDARTALNTLEMVVLNGESSEAESSSQKRCWSNVPPRSRCCMKDRERSTTI